MKLISKDSLQNKHIGMALTFTAENSEITTIDLVGCFLFDPTRKVNYLIIGFAKLSDNPYITIKPCNGLLKARVNKGNDYYITPNVFPK